MKILFILLVAIWPFFSGKPVQDAVVILENIRNREPVAWQQTGENGKVTFQHLDAGSYRLLFDFPQLEGKWIKANRRNQVLTKSSYNPKNKTYYYQGEEGFFAVKFSQIRRIESENFNAVFQEIRMEERNEYVIARFQTFKNGARISLLVKKLTAAQFKRAVEKIDQDISHISIPRYN